MFCCTGSASDVVSNVGSATATHKTLLVLRATILSDKNLDAVVGTGAVGSAAVGFAAAGAAVAVDADAVAVVGAFGTTGHSLVVQIENFEDTLPKKHQAGCEPSLAKIPVSMVAPYGLHCNAVALEVALVGRHNSDWKDVVVAD